MEKGSQDVLTVLLVSQLTLTHPTVPILAKFAESSSTPLSSLLGTSNKPLFLSPLTSTNPHYGDSQPAFLRAIGPSNGTACTGVRQLLLPDHVLRFTRWYE